MPGEIPQWGPSIISGGNLRTVGKRKTFRHEGEDVPLHQLENRYGGEAYGTTQVEESINFGDLLEVPSEKVAGMLYSAWPTVATEATAGMHQIHDPEAGVTSESGEPNYARRYRAAQALARKRGYPLDTQKKEND